MSDASSAASHENWLYRNPALYDQVYGGLCEETAALVLQEARPSHTSRIGAILDVGCGTGMVLRRLAAFSDRMVGIDLNPEMVRYAKQLLPEGEFVVSDMRDDAQIGEFDVILCVGSVISYLFSNSDVSRALLNLRKQLKPNGTLLLGLWDAGNLIGARPNLPTSFKVQVDGFSATGSASYSVNQNLQRLTRERNWETSDGRRISDQAEYRLLFPLELDFFLEMSGFSRRRRIAAEGGSNQSRLFIAAMP